jgi:hypothetical protein
MKVRVNRAPVLTLWAAVVAERLGHDRDEALTLGRAVAGYAAYAKAKSLGLAEEREVGDLEPKRGRAPTRIEFMGRRIPVLQTPEGLRAVDADGKPLDPAAARRYVASRFGAVEGEVRAAMEALARSVRPAELRARAFALYESFRPEIPAGVAGWGARGELDLARIRAAAGRKA